jgi:uncharacterized protein YpuA (DUF1002 family)
MIPELNIRPGKKSHIFKVWALLVVVALLTSVAANHGIAANSGKTITLGESLSPEQRTELLKYFGYRSSQDRDPITVTAEDTAKAMEGISTYDPSMGAFSSTALTCRELGDGLDVTTRNITLVTPSMFAMALVTAGIGDAKLVVAAPDAASAFGLTALTGVFRTWEIAPCESGNTTGDRQRLALEELTLTADIGRALTANGVSNGVQLASNLVLESQKTIVIEKLNESEEIDRAIADQEVSAGISIPPDLRNRLIDLMVRLQKEKIDWSTFSAGWTIEYNENNTQIKMRGDGIAIRQARQTATAQASNQMTATAQAGAQLTAEAGAALTATAEAKQPEQEPTATPGPSTVSGSITNIGDGEITIDGGSGGESTYKLDADAAILQGDAKIAVTALAVGDDVTATIEGGSTVVSMSVSVPAPGIMSKLARFVLVIPVLVMVPIVVILVKKRPVREPFIVRRVAA